MTAIKAGVIGHPIRHSKSPIIHSYWIAQHGLDGSYEAIDIAPENLKKEVVRLIEEGFAGFNVTLPHKQAIFDLCDDVDDTARAIGAVNTVMIKNEKLYGTNTDAFGFIENIRQSLPAFDFTKGPAVVIGAGGAARAVVYGLLQAGVPTVAISNRTEDKARDIQEMKETKIAVFPWEARAKMLQGAHLVVNSTALGMTGKEALDISLDYLSPEAAVCDIVYAPLMTPLLQAAEARGNAIVTGIGMLLHQARPAFQQWFGVLPDVTDALERIVLA